jgi:hypothetical protein
MTALSTACRAAFPKATKALPVRVPGPHIVLDVVPDVVLSKETEYVGGIWGTLQHYRWQ